MWARRSHLLQPLTTLTPEKLDSKWIDIDQKEFDDMKYILDKKNLLTHPNLMNNLIPIRILAITS